MSKVNIKSILENASSNERNEYNTLGIKNKNKINYKEDNINVSIDLDNIKIIRKDDIKEIVLEFKEKENTCCTYKVYNNVYKLNIFTNKIEINDNYIEIDYIIEDDKINFKLYIK